MKMTNELFCKNIKTLREKAGLSQEKAAEAVGVNIRTYQRYESGEASPSDSKKDLLAQAFHASVSDFYSERLDSSLTFHSSKAELLTEIYSLAPSAQEDQLKEILALLRRNK